MKNRELVNIIFPFLRIGGLENLLVLTANKLTEKGYKVKIITLYVHENIKKEISPNIDISIPTKMVSDLMKNSILLRYIFGIQILLLLIFINRSKSTFICFGNISVYLSFIVKYFEKKMRIVFYETDIKYPNKIILPTKSIYQYIGQYLNFYLQDFFDNVFINKVWKLIVIDDKNENFAKQVYPFLKNKTVKIYPPLTINSSINKENISSKILEIFKSKKSKFLIIVGALDYKKQTVKAIDLLEYILTKNLNYSLLIVGDGELKKDLENDVVRRGLEKHVYFLGKINYDELKYCYSQSYCNLFLAKFQTWGLTPFEALSQGRPSIVSSDCGCSTYLKSKKCSKIIDENFNYEEMVDFLENEIPKKIFSLKELHELESEYYIKRFIEVLTKN